MSKYVKHIEANGQTIATLRAYYDERRGAYFGQICELDGNVIVRGKSCTSEKEAIEKLLSHVQKTLRLYVDRIAYYDDLAKRERIKLASVRGALELVR